MLYFVTQDGVFVDVAYFERSIKVSDDNGQTWRSAGFHSLASLTLILQQPRHLQRPRVQAIRGDDAGGRGAGLGGMDRSRGGRGGRGGRGARGGKACWNCGSEVHLSRNCPETPTQDAENICPVTTRKFRGQRCFNCGEAGHIAAGCQYKDVGPKCYRCEQYGRTEAYEGRATPAANLTCNLLPPQTSAVTVRRKPRRGLLKAAARHLEPRSTCLAFSSCGQGGACAKNPGEQVHFWGTYMQPLDRLLGHFSASAQSTFWGGSACHASREWDLGMPSHLNESVEGVPARGAVLLCLDGSES